VATSEPVVHHHGREEGFCRSRRGTAVCFNGLKWLVGRQHLGFFRVNVAACDKRSPPQLDGYDLHDGLARSARSNRGIVS